MGKKKKIRFCTPGRCYGCARDTEVHTSIVVLLQVHLIQGARWRCSTAVPFNVTASRLTLSVECIRRKSKLTHFSSGSARSSLLRPTILLLRNAARPVNLARTQSPTV